MDKIKEGSQAYKAAGVDTAEGQRAVELMKKHVKETLNENVLTGLGSFGGIFKLPCEGMKEPVLVSGTDGVGTKLKLAFMMDRHDTIGIDAVAMCVNDVLCQGAKPLFFLDYIATGKVTGEKIADIVSGVAEGCKQGNMALIGGETAEMPGFYGDGEYDIAGFAVGIADRDDIITGADIGEGHVIVGLASSGFHSNGYSLIRRVFLDEMGMGVDDEIRELGETLGEALIRPTKIYARQCEAVKGVCRPDGIVHITGGGFYENIPRVLPEGIGVKIHKGTWEVPPAFELIKNCGGLTEDDMFKTFNMGIGMMFFVKEEYGEKVRKAVEATGEKAYIIGKTVACGEGEKVEICG